MGRFRRLFRRRGVDVPGGFAPAPGPLGAAVIEGSSRRAFLQASAGAAGGAAMVFAGPKVAALALDAARPGEGADAAAVVTKPSGATPREPVTAYVRDVERGEVTVLSGTFEETYRDPVLVKRLLDATR